MRRQAAYLRTSTAQQPDGLQREAIQRAAAARGELIDLWFSESRGGDVLDRPELDAVRGLARRGELSRLWVFRLDRLTRRGPADLLGIVSELRRHGCAVTSVSDGFDLDGPAADVVLAVLAFAAEMELEAIRARVAAAKRKAEKAGKRWGRPPAGTADQRAQLRQAIEQGLTLRSAAKQAGLSYGTAQRILSADRQA